MMDLVLSRAVNELSKWVGDFSLAFDCLLEFVEKYHNTDSGFQFLGTEGRPKTRQVISLCGCYIPDEEVPGVQLLHETERQPGNSPTRRCKISGTKTTRGVQYCLTAYAKSPNSLARCGYMSISRASESTK